MIRQAKVAISVIVPVYNAEDFLRNALESILKQDFNALEVILVNDGSTDLSLSICREYANIDSRITVIDKENGGVASARDAGLKAATGKYIIHADSDDVVLPNAYRRMFQCAESSNADIVIASYIKGATQNRQTVNHESEVANADVLITSLLNGDVHGSLWNKLIKASMYDGLSFPVGNDFMEDLQILVQMLILKSPRINVLNGDPVYFNVTHRNSYTNNISAGYLEKGDAVIKALSELLSEYTKFQPAIEIFKLNQKLLYILNTDTRKIDIKALYPEVNKAVFWAPLPIKYRLLLIAELYNFHVVSELYKALKRISLSLSS